MKNTMEYKGFKAQIMEAERLVGDQIHGLPPGTALAVYHSEEFVNYPEQWMKGPGVFVVPVKPNKGLWFDFTDNMKNNTAIVPTVKGCNPITGLQTSGIHLERYDTKCPKHNVEFKGDRFCTDCGHKWPTQNYIAGPNTLWWDGFRADDGTVRQFFFTEDEMRDVATHMIGKENTVPAFGFAFYTPKEPRPEPKVEYRGMCDFKSYEPITWTTYTTSDYGYYKSLPYGGGGTTTSAVYCNCLSEASNSIQTYDTSISSTETNTKAKLKRLNNVRYRSIEPVKEVSIGAGAKINQELVADPYALDTWKESPDASMVIYFVFQKKLEELMAGGMVDLVGKKEGMLDGIPVG